MIRFGGPGINGRQSQHIAIKTGKTCGMSSRADQLHQAAEIGGKRCNTRPKPIPVVIAAAGPDRNGIAIRIAQAALPVTCRIQRLNRLAPAFQPRHGAVEVHAADDRQQWRRQLRPLPIGRRTAVSQEFEHDAAPEREVIGRLASADDRQPERTRIPLGELRCRTSPDQQDGESKTLR